VLCIRSVETAEGVAASPLKVIFGEFFAHGGWDWGMWAREFKVVYVVELSIKPQDLLKIVRCRVSAKGCLLQKQNILGHQGKSYGKYQTE
jgi:hypothetical protein